MGPSQRRCFREVFVGVKSNHQKQGIGTELWARLLEAAKNDPGVRFLVGMVTPDSAEWSIPRLRAAGFEERPGPGGQATWLLQMPPESD
jgi:L-amino acid N-acyltransferase YncA